MRPEITAEPLEETSSVFTVLMTNNTYQFGKI